MEAQEVRGYADERKKASESVIDAQRVIAETERAIKLREQAIMKEITAAMNGEGKPLFSNEAARHAELCLRCEADDRILEMRTTFEAYKEAAGRDSITAEYFRDLIRIGCAFAEAQKG